MNIVVDLGTLKRPVGIFIDILSWNFKVVHSMVPLQVVEVDFVPRIDPMLIMSLPQRAGPKSHAFCHSFRQHKFFLGLDTGTLSVYG